LISLIAQLQFSVGNAPAYGNSTLSFRGNLIFLVD
jgi:hypothetical protein